MADQTHVKLRELQEIDRRIVEAEDRIRGFEPQLAEVDEPALQLEQEVVTTRARLREMKVDEKRIEMSAEERRQRTQRLQDRLGGVRNVREEAAVGVEIQLLRRALDGDEQEAFTLLDQIRRMEVRLEEQEKALEQAHADVEPRRQALATAREEEERDLVRLREERETLARTMEPRHLHIYEGIRCGGRRRAVAPLTPDGACGNCFSVVPLQRQNEVRAHGAMVRCEACGVILTVDPEDG